MNTLEEYFRMYGAGTEPSSDAGMHTSQKAPSENYAWKQPDFGKEEVEETSIWEKLGAKNSSKYGGEYAQASAPDMSREGDIGAIIQKLNAMGHRGQQPYQDFTQGFNNSYIQKLLGGMR